MKSYRINSFFYLILFKRRLKSHCLVRYSKLVKKNSLLNKRSQSSIFTLSWSSRSSCISLTILKNQGLLLIHLKCYNVFIRNFTDLKFSKRNEFDINNIRIPKFPSTCPLQSKQFDLGRTKERTCSCSVENS